MTTLATRRQRPVKGLPVTLILAQQDLLPGTLLPGEQAPSNERTGPSMTSLRAHVSQAPTDSADDGLIETLLSVASHLPGGLLGLLVAVVLLGTFATKGKKPSPSGHPDDALFKATTDAAKGTWKVTRALIRFACGKELRGAPRSTATMWRPGKPLPRLIEAKKQTTMASLAMPAPKVSLVKHNPHPWARKAAKWIATHDGKAARCLDTSARVLRSIARCYHRVRSVLGPPLRTIAHVLRAWACWPYAARGAARLALTAAVVGLAVPGWRVVTIAALTSTAVAVGVLAHRRQPKPPSDDETYGPRLWPLVRADLKLDEETPREDWLTLPEQLARPDARVVIKLPWTWRGSDTDREALTGLINTRLPGQWVARFEMKGETGKVTYTHKPPPKPPEPEPEPPTKVDLFGDRIQDAIKEAQAKPETYVFGVDEADQVVEIPLVGEQAHVAVSVGTGGGKSALLQMLATQVIRRRGTILAVDPKMVSLRLLEGIDGVYLYNDPGQGGDMRRALEWAAEVVEARFYEYLTGNRKNFPPLFVYLEETNELTGILKSVWMRIKDKDEPNQDPIWESVASILRKGRQVNVHVVAVFQDLKDTDFSGVSLGLLFPVKIMGAYVKKQWDRIVGSNVAMPVSERKAGRLVGVKNGVAFRFQAPYAIVDDPELSKDERAEEAESRIRKHCLKLRDRYKWDSSGLYVAPPAPSPRHIPALLEEVSRDTGPLGLKTAPGGGQDDETAGGLSRSEGSVTLLEGGVTASRDRLRLIPGQGAQEGQEVTQDPTAPPELLPLAEIARRMEGEVGIPTADTMRAHKRRRDDFPRPTNKDGKDLYTISQITAYYVAQKKNA